LLRSSTDLVLSTPKLVDARVRGVAAVGNHLLPEQATVTQHAIGPTDQSQEPDSETKDNQIATAPQYQIP
jgi:hypothetical protein